MNAYNPLDAAKRLEAAGIERRQAEAIASEITSGTNELVTQQMLDAALDRQTIKLGGYMTALIALATTILGVLVSIK